MGIAQAVGPALLAVRFAVLVERVFFDGTYRSAFYLSLHH
jgi:hypothetical protein